jgi:hypothetical protein
VIALFGLLSHGRLLWFSSTPEAWEPWAPELSACLYLATTGLGYVTAVLATYVVFSWSFPRVPGRSAVKKGLVFGVALIFLAHEGIGREALFRAEYESLRAAAIHQALSWFGILAMSVVISLFVQRRAA